MRSPLLAGLAAACICLLPTPVHLFMAARTVPIVFDVDLRVGTSRSGSFTVHSSTTYEVLLQVDTPIADEIQCFLDAGVFADRCATDPLGLSWRVMSLGLMLPRSGRCGRESDFRW